MAGASVTVGHPDAVDDGGLVDDGAVAAAVALASARAGCAARAVEVRRTPAGAVLALAGAVVVKVHRAGTDPQALAARLAVAADPIWGDCLLAPLHPRPIPLGLSGSAARVATSARRVTPGGGWAGERWASLWPRVETLAPEPEGVPWATAGALLARLHVHAVPGRPFPEHGAVARVRRALASLDTISASGRRWSAAPSPVPTTHPGSLSPRPGPGTAPGSMGHADLVTAVRTVRAAARSLPAEAWHPTRAGRPVTLVHGDWHLGQLGCAPRPSVPTVGAWRLLDVDDLGLGDPTWDFARPAALLAAEILPVDGWIALIDSYRSAGGPALPAPPAAPWPALDAVARAGVVQATASAVCRAAEQARDLDDADRALLAACRALAGAPG